MEVLLMAATHIGAQATEVFPARESPRLFIPTEVIRHQALVSDKHIIQVWMTVRSSGASW
jgi:hypothetical protein